MNRSLASAVILLLAACAPPAPRPVTWPGSAPPSAPAPAVADTTRIYEERELPSRSMPQLLNRNTVARELERSYPPQLRDLGTKGEVTVRLVVERTGVPSALEVVRGTDPEFAAAALRVIRTMRFQPAAVGSVPVRVRVTIPVTFTPAS